MSAKGFQQITEQVKEDSAKGLKKTIDFIVDGMDGNKDRGLQLHSTTTRWEQYCSSAITRNEAIAYAVRRVTKANSRELEEELSKLGEIGSAPVLDKITILVEMVKTRAYGYCPRVSVKTETGTYSGEAGGYGYDKISAATAAALNQCPSVVRMLCDLKEAALLEGKSDASAGSVGGRDNWEVCGYGAGYAAIPMFAGGVGLDSFWSIFKTAGFKIERVEGKRATVYVITRK